MPYFVIVGKADCPNFTHVVYVARYLNEYLPNFHLSVRQKGVGDWEEWLTKVREKYEWTLKTSPIIYRQLVFRGGNPHLLGGIGEFWQYCFDFYNVESLLPHGDLLKLMEDNKMGQKTDDGDKDAYKKQDICIFGASSPSLHLLLEEMATVLPDYFSSKTKIKLFDFFYEPDNIPTIVKDIFDEETFNYLLNLEIVNSIETAIKNTHLIIIIDNLERKPDEIDHQWRLRNIIYMHYLIDFLNSCASKTTRIILAHFGSVCFNATLLVDFCTKIKPHNIVAVTSDIGLGYINAIAKKADLLVEELGAPVVWGCIGINEFIDVGSTIKKCDIYRPNVRVIRTNGGSTLPLGTIRTELRFINYITDGYPDLKNEVDRTRQCVRTTFERPPIYSKVRAIISLLKLWYSNEQSDAIISLGVSSDGSFNLTPGVVFSQPVILKNGIWTPFSEFPILESSKKKILELDTEANTFLNYYIVSKKIPYKDMFV